MVPAVVKVDLPADGERGSVTAEFVAVVPAVILVLALCLSALQVATLQLRLQDAAYRTAHTIARGGGFADSAPALVHGASLAVESRGELVCARLGLEARILGGVIAGIQLAATSCSPSSTIGIGG